MRGLLALLAVLLLAMPVFALNPNEVLDDPALEARAREISAELRCLVCQNQSIEDSDAGLASELRVIVRERLVAGDSDQATIQYIVDRYGEYVLLRPVVGWHTILLWIAAPALLLIGAAVLLVTILRRRSAPQAASQDTALSPEEVAALGRLERPAGRD